MLMDSTGSCRMPESTWLMSSMAKATAKRKTGLLRGRARRICKVWISDGDHLCENGVSCRMKQNRRVQRSFRASNRLQSSVRISYVPERPARRLVDKIRVRSTATTRSA
jgi:hypothetical protein